MVKVINRKLLRNAPRQKRTWLRMKMPKSSIGAKLRLMPSAHWAMLKAMICKMKSGASDMIPSAP